MILTHFISAPRISLKTCHLPRYTVKSFKCSIINGCQTVFPCCSSFIEKFVCAGFLANKPVNLLLIFWVSVPESPSLQNGKDYPYLPHEDIYLRQITAAGDTHA